jgi:hypothetical protein
MARKQFVETPRQIVERVLRDTQVLIDMSEIEQDERSAAQVERELPAYVPVAGGSVQRSAQERREHQRGEFSFMR